MDLPTPKKTRTRAPPRKKTKLTDENFYVAGDIQRGFVVVQTERVGEKCRYKLSVIRCWPKCDERQGCGQPISFHFPVKPFRLCNWFALSYRS